VISNHTFYKTSYKKYGLSARGLNWNSEENQEIRFQVLSDFLAGDIATSSIVDAGCGFGDLYLYWQKMGIKPKSYVGIDSFEKFISLASQRVSNVAFLKKDVLKDTLPLADWYVASGSLNILSSFDTWLFLEKMLLHSHKGIVFNILSGERKSEVFNYKTKKEIVEFAKQKSFTCKIVEGYLPNDMSIKIVKKKDKTEEDRC
jgi:SAM-dependent methyltransferase